MFTAIIVRVALGFYESSVETTPSNISRHSILPDISSLKNDNKGWRLWPASSRLSSSDRDHDHHPMQPLSIVVTQLTHNDARDNENINNGITVPGTTGSTSRESLGDYDGFAVKASRKNNQDEVSYLNF